MPQLRADRNRLYSASTRLVMLSLCKATSKEVISKLYQTKLDVTERILSWTNSQREANRSSNRWTARQSQGLTVRTILYI